MLRIVSLAKNVSQLLFFLLFSPFAAMSSYLYIVKYELPIVIQAFLGSSSNG